MYLATQGQSPNRSLQAFRAPQATGRWTFMQPDAWSFVRCGLLQAPDRVTHSPVVNNQARLDSTQLCPFVRNLTAPPPLGARHPCQGRTGRSSLQNENFSLPLLNRSPGADDALRRTIYRIALQEIQAGSSELICSDQASFLGIYPSRALSVARGPSTGETHGGETHGEETATGVRLDRKSTL